MRDGTRRPDLRVAAFQLGLLTGTLRPCPSCVVALGLRSPLFFRFDFVRCGVGDDTQRDGQRFVVGPISSFPTMRHMSAQDQVYSTVLS